MRFSPTSAVLGLLVLVPIAWFLGQEFGGPPGAIGGLIFGIALSVLGSFKKRKKENG